MALIGALSGMACAQTDSTQVKNDSIAWSRQLDGIEVKAQRQLVKQEIDRIGYDVQADEDSKTQTVLDLLRKVPMVSVDGQDNILVKGSSNYKIYRNGHQDPSLSRNAKEILKAMPASAVKKIEVITDPGAREDAEGVNAILNIVMMNNSAMGGITGSVAAAYTSNNHPNLNTFLTMQLGRLVLSVDYGYGGMSRKETGNSYDYTAYYKQSSNTMAVHGESNNPGAIHFADINASYDLDSLNLISGSFSGYFYKLNVQGDNDYLTSDADGLPLYSYHSHYWMPGYEHNSWNGRLDFQHKTRLNGEKLTLSYMMALTRQHTEQEDTYSAIYQVPFNYTGFLTRERENFNEHTFQLDYVRPFGKHHKLETGLKYIFRDNNSHTGQTYYEAYPQPLPKGGESRFQHSTHVGAAYTDYTFTCNKWSARAGLRYEHSLMKARYPDGSGTAYDCHLNDWVPQASLKYQFTDAHSLKLNYTTSIQRPGISYLNPAVISTPTSIQMGDASLKSSRSQGLGLIYMFVGKNLTLNFSPNYTFANDWIGVMQTVSNDVTTTTYGNIIDYRRFTVTAYTQWKPFSTTTIVFNGAVNRKYMANPNLALKLDQWEANGYFHLTQQLPWKLKFTTSGGGSIAHSPSSVYAYNGPYSWYDFSIQRSFLKDDRLTVRILASQPFTKYYKSSQHTVNGDCLSDRYSRYCSSYYSVSVRFRFGSLKASVKKTDTTIENSDVVGGISKDR